MSSCDHPLKYADLCTICGAHVPSTEDNNMIPSGQANLSLSISATEAAKRAADQRSKLISSRRLTAVLDLDHTLLHCTAVPFTNLSKIPFSQSDLEQASTPSAPVTFFDLDGFRYFLQIRPFAREFIKKLSTVFDVYVFTMGTRAYAFRCLHHLQVLSEIPESHVFSRDDVDSKTGRKTIIRIFPTGTTMTIILDDNFPVWGAFGPLVHIIPPFIHWNRERYVDPWDMVLPPSPKDKSLLEVLELFLFVHMKFYQYFDRNEETTVGAILTGRREGAMAGVKVMMVNVPKYEDLCFALSRCSGEVVGSLSDCTHLVCNSQSTELYHQAIAKGDVFVVALSWLYQSLAGLKRCSEARHLLSLQATASVNPDFCDDVVEIIELLQKKRSKSIFDQLMDEYFDDD
ncbi:hypothetical protein GEMRC1_004749 [Eukaryota sp. GEM-RC1]